MTSVRGPSPSAPVFTNRKIQATPDAVILRVNLAVNRNAVAVCDRRDKKRSRGRIGSIVALAMAVVQPRRHRPRARFQYGIAWSYGNDGGLVLSSRVDMLHSRDNNQYDRPMTEIRIIPSGSRWFCERSRQKTVCHSTGETNYSSGFQQV
jgi:hypothetical protein